jgi:hypothetical protein
MMKADRMLLEAALFGYKTKIAEIQEAIAGLPNQPDQTSSSTFAPAKQPRKKLSAASRKKMAAAQKKRWAEYRTQKPGT